MSSAYKVVAIGGSAGSFQVVGRILQGLPRGFSLPLLLCLHRRKHVRSGFVEALSQRSVLPVVEPYDKDVVREGVAYIAPANYHMYVEVGGRFALSAEGMLNHSRPSIDLTFYSVARTYRDKAVGIVLSGANRDGAAGLSYLKRLGGVALVQSLSECEVRTMPEAAKECTDLDGELRTEELVEYLKSLC